MRRCVRACTVFVSGWSLRGTRLDGENVVHISRFERVCVCMCASGVGEEAEVEVLSTCVSMKLEVG